MTLTITTDEEVDMDEVLERMPISLVMSESSALLVLPASELPALSLANPKLPFTSIQIAERDTMATAGAEPFC